MFERVAGAWPARRWVLLLLGLALLLRLVHLATIVGSPFLERLGLDPLFHEEWGRRIAAGDWIGEGLFYQDPLYPYFLGVVYAIFGPNRIVAVAIQLVLGSLVAPMLFAATDRVLGRGAAIVAGLLAAAYLPSIYYEGLILKAWMDLFFTAASFWTLGRAIAERRLGFWCATGALLGLGCLVRGNLLLPLAALAVWVLVDRSATVPKGRSRFAWREGAALVLGAAVVLGVVATRNRVVGGEWIVTTAQAGQNFYQGNNAGATTGRYVALPFVRSNPKYEEHDFVAEAERRSGRTMTTRDASRFWFAEALAWIRSHPGDWLRLMAKKVVVLWEAYEVPDNLDYYVYRETAPVLRLPLPGFGLVAPLGLLGAFLLRNRPGWARGILVHFTVYAGSVLLFFVIARYRLAMIPALFPMAGYAVVHMARAARDAVQGRGSGAWAIALGVALVAFSNLPVRTPANHWSARLAAALHLPARPESSSIAHFNLGVLNAQDGRLPDAETELREALRQDPAHEPIYVELGKVLAREGRTDEAIEMYARAVAIEPRDAAVYHVLGILNRRRGAVEAAKEAFRKALELDPRRQDSARELGSLEDRSGPGPAPRSP
jgi:4-amino-4-deoxy-L-arabinose transferase-like glycosyltransferase